MLMRFQIAIFFFLIALICSWNAGKAQASDSLPPQIQRNWALPDCGTYDQTLVLSKYFALTATQTDIGLYPARLVRKAGDYWVIDIGGTKSPVQLENDGILALGTYDEDSARQAKNWDGLNLNQTDEYTGCDNAPKIVPKSMLRLMRYIDRISEQCTLSITNECEIVLFKLTDANNDKVLSHDEVRHMAAQAVLLAALAEKGTLTDKQTAQILKDARKDIETITEDLFKTCDKGQDKTIDYNELAKNFAAPAVPRVKEMMEKIGQLIPAFKMAALALK
jgi:hypothetical protein